VYRVSRNQALAIIGVSAVVSVCTAPLYLIAEKWQQAERDLQKKFKPKTDKIKSVFKGDEQYMILSAFYRQNHYHPVYGLRNSFGILIQIPFFIAAYSWLSHLEAIKGISFLFIRDLGAPDGLLSINNGGGGRFNILPLIMTLINCISGFVYTKDKTIQEKLQIYGLALVFLVLLYNSPSGLVLYWTMNNIFSLLKNILAENKYKLKIIYGFLCLCVILLYVRFIPLGFSPKRIFVLGFCSIVFFIPLIIKLLRFIKEKISKIITLEQTSLSVDGTYILSALDLCALCGLVIPGSLIASSVQEFSFLDSYTSPLPFIFTVFVQSAGVFLLWPLCIYFLFPKKIKRGLTLIISLLLTTALVNTFLFPGDYGNLTTTFKFSNPDTFESKNAIIVLSSVVTLCILTGFTCLLLIKRKIIIYYFQLIILISLTFFGVINIYKINRDFTSYKNLLAKHNMNTAETEEIEPVYHLTRNGKNVIVFMLDAAVSGYIPYIFTERPELLQDFSGFTYYPNCVSLGGHTRIGAPALFGGYEYEPSIIQKDRSYAMKKHNSALLMIPRIFNKEDYNVTVTDPSFANYSLTPDLSIFAPYPQIQAQNIQGKYTGKWLRSHPELKIVSVPEILHELLIRFSFLKIAPPVFRVFIYDKALWLKLQGSLTGNQLSVDTLDYYSTMDYLPLLTNITDDTRNTYISMVNDLTHDPVLLQYPDYVPAMETTNTDNGLFPGDNGYHINISAVMLVGKWLKFLQEQGVYDNTRIVIASDHGRDVKSNYSGNITLPNGHRLARYHALLMTKDFNAHGEPVTDTTFMTHADVPLLAMQNLIDKPQNPFSGLPIKTEKENGVFIATSSTLQYKIASDQWLYVHNDIFKPENWKKK
jgi:YidC/Oxa1 family membrane protein insertase